MRFGGRRAALPLSLWLPVGAWLAGCSSGGGTEDARAQVARGEQLYQQRCAVCHQPGGIGRDLTASLLATRGTALRVFTDIRTTMPYDDPGSLPEQDYWDVTAYLLSDRGLIDPQSVLSRDNGGDLRLATE